MISIRAELDIIRREELSALNCDISRQPSSSVRFSVARTHPSFDAILDLVRSWEGTTLREWKRFDHSDYRAASWLRMTAGWSNGYPQPEATFREIVWDQTIQCPKCRVPKRQIAPYQIKGEPRWGKHSVMGLHGVFSEMFTRPELFTEVFEPLGFTTRPVLNKKGTQELETVVQLVLEEPTVPVRTEGLETEVCPACGVVKYNHPQGDYYPKIARETDAEIVRTEQYFGSGGAADQLFYVSNRVYRELTEKIGTKRRDLVFDPVAE